MIDKAKLIYRALEGWAQEMPAKRFKALIITLWSCVLVCFVLLLVLLANKPSYEPDGLETDNNLLQLNNQYIALQGSFEALAADYNNLQATLASTVYNYEASKQITTAYAQQNQELLHSYQSLSVAMQLLEASNKGLSQVSDVSQEFSSQYDALVILHKEKSDQYEALLDKIDEVSTKGFFVESDNFTLTDNFTQADMDSFYSGWEFWVESLEAEE